MKYRVTVAPWQTADILKLRRQKPQLDPSIRTYLSILEADKRGIRLRFSSDEPLRAPTSRSQRRRFKGLRSDLQEAARGRFVRRAAFRGPVSVEASFFMRTAAEVSLHRIVKAYLDLLKGIAYRDDSSISHLMVDRVTLSKNGNDLFEGLPFTPPKSADVEVFMIIKPLRIYRDQLDRAVTAEGQGDSWDLDFGSLDLFDLSPWEPDTESEENASALSDIARNIGNHFPSLSLEQRKELAISYERRADEARTKIITSIPFQITDRPGGLIGTSLFQGAHPGEILLPPPHPRPQQTPWDEEVEEDLRRHKARWRILSKSLMPPVGLDIAVPDTSPYKDLDNLAATVASRVEQVFFDLPPGSVTTYRVYWVKAPRPDLRLRLMNPAQMRALPEAISRVHRSLGGNLP